MNAELFAFVLYFVMLVGVGLFFFFKGRHRANEKEYFLGGRSMGPWVTAMSAQASDMSAWLLMGLPGSILARTDVDWHRSGSGNGGQLDFLSKAIEKIFQSSGRCDHSSPVFEQSVHG